MGTTDCAEVRATATRLNTPTSKITQMQMAHRVGRGMAIQRRQLLIHTSRTPAGDDTAF